MGGVTILDIFNYPIDGQEILRNKKTLKRKLIQENSFIKKKIAILSGSTIGDISNILELFLLNHGIEPEYYIGQYNRFYEESIFENIELKQFNPDIIYIHTSNKNIEQFPEVDDDELICCNKLEEQYRKFEKIWKSLKKEYDCPIIQNNFEMIPYRVLGNADIYLKNGANHFVHQLNSKLYEYANKNNNFFINDINYLSSWIGLEKWSEPSYWYLYKYCLNMEHIPILCNSIANIIKSILGKNKKALVLDLDNTLWGGVIGDDGVEAIEIGYETPEGAAYYEFQKYIKKLSKLGVVLNVCSKNENEIARLGFSHPASALNVSDFILFKANWVEKYKNITEIIEELNIMADSVVFIDDNQMERDSIRSFIPEVTVLEIKEAEDYIKMLDQSGYFEVTSLSKDDTDRQKFYKANQERETFKAEFNNYEEYLLSLDMSSNMSNFQMEYVQRITQLINKTNQFNLTNKRYTQSEIEQIIKNGEHITLFATLSDKFGDNGITSILIGETNKDVLEIINWVMSCRVFKRNLEFAIFDQLVRICKEKKIKNIIGWYKETNKNAFVKVLYKDLGFSMIEKSESGSKWEYNIPDKYHNKNKEIEVLFNE